MPDDKLVEWLKKEQDEQTQWVRLVWTEYMKWFTFFCGLNITALGALRFIDVTVQPYIEFVLVSLNLGGILSTLFIASYSRSSADAVKSIADEQIKALGVKGEDRIRSSIPLDLAAWISFSAFTTFLLFISIWISFILSSANIREAITARSGGWCGFAILLTAILITTGLSGWSFVLAVLAERKSRYRLLLSFSILSAIDLALLVRLSVILISGTVP